MNTILKNAEWIEISGSFMVSEYVVKKEGLARILVPNPDKYRRSDGVYEPAWAPVFYNPAMVSNRDSTIVVLKALNVKIGFAADSLAGTGVRGIRIALEVGGVEQVLINDIDATAFNIMKKNVELNPTVKHKVKVFRMDANEFHGFLRRIGLKPDYIDVDPYGSPAPFTFTALYAVRKGGIIGFTATDLAPLGGKYPWKSMRRYQSHVIKTDFYKEMMLRNLLGFIARTATVIDKVVEPLLSYVHRHYARVYVRVYEGASRANDVLKRCLGYIEYCVKCGYRRVVQGVNSRNFNRSCPICLSKIEVLGPIWIGGLSDREFVSEAIDVARRIPWLESRRDLVGILESLRTEVCIDNPYFRISKVASYLKVNMPSVRKVIQCLREKGYQAVRSYMDVDSVRTNASYNDVIECVKSTFRQ
ncbi:MAG: tRNA (guanine(10)-N(2))-dimethyltransferase [Thermoprotei archaeon]|nr:MAG: tRNA (guanine(10)-N(2))-dimethyltransferase [Thermoprotei archaeon]